MNMHGHWTYNRKGDDFWQNNIFETKEAAVQAGINNPDIPEQFEVGQVKEWKASDFNLSAENFLEQLNEIAYSMCGEVAEEGIDFVLDIEEFEKLFKEFVDTYIEKPNWYNIENVEIINKNMED